MTHRERLRNHVEDGLEVELPARIDAMLANGPAAPHFARLQGFLGQPCRECKAYRLRASGSCAVCENCGASAGCS